MVVIHSLAPYNFCTMKYNLSLSKAPSTDSTHHSTCSGNWYRIRLAIASFMATLLVLSSLSGVFGTAVEAAHANPSNSSNSSSAADHRERAQDARERAEAADARAAELQGEIRVIDENMEYYAQQAAELTPQVSEATDRTAELTSEVNALQAEVDALTIEIKETEIELAHQQELLNARAVSTYRGEQSAFLAVLFGAKDLSDLIARAENIMVVLDHNSQISYDLTALSRQLETDKNRLDEILVEVSDRRAEAATAEAELRTLQQRAQSAADTAAQLSRERSELLADTQANAARLRALAAEEDAMAAQLARELAGGGSLGGSTGSGVFEGSMTWPVPGFHRISSGFGWRSCPIRGVQSFHSGIDIAGPGINGAAVVASGDGRVISAGWRGGFGNTVIIDHGDGVTTLYAHLLSGGIHVSVGQQVTAGQRIGSVGSTGFSTGPHLHWEVRVNGQPRDPRTF
jgi:murein DD-endopeptidase MepM/ murein hydrolase activator NlpD